MPRGGRKGVGTRKGKLTINASAVARAEQVLAVAASRSRHIGMNSKRNADKAAAARSKSSSVFHVYDIEPKDGNYPHYDKALRYAREVVAQKQVAGELIQLACARFLSMLDDDRFIFKREMAERVCNHIESMPHAKGRWETPNIQLGAWQCWVVCGIFGFYWAHAPTQRVVKSVYEEVARKNAKSTFAAAIGNYMLAEDGEEGAEVYSAATTHKQATAIFDTARLMAMKQTAYQERHGITVGAHTISIWGTLSKFEALHAEGNSLDGLNIHCALIDELHAHKSRSVYEVLETAVGSRVSPLLFNITTAGTNRSGICYEVRGYNIRVLRGQVDDPTWFCAIYTIDPEDLKNWSDERVWIKSNPNLDVSVRRDELKRLAKKALVSPSSLNNFLTKHLNVWVNAGAAWMNMQAWADCARPGVTEEDFLGSECIVAADLASRIDIASVCKIFSRMEVNPSTQAEEKHYYCFWRHYLPESTVQASEDQEDRHSANASYSGWKTDGHLVVTPGSTTDQDRIEADFLSDAERYLIREVGFDPYQSAALMARLEKEGFTVVEVKPTVLNFSAPMKEVEALVKEGRLHHTGEPVIEWMMSNVVCHSDQKDNIYPRKEQNANKIDGAVALIMGFNRVLAAEQGTGEGGPSVYEERGVLSIG